jgi:hypothetical protein
MELPVEAVVEAYVGASHGDLRESLHPPQGCGRTASGEWIRTFTIITTEANDLVRELHDRMPVVIGPDDRDRWLNGPEPQERLRTYPAHLMTMWPVSMRVNTPKNDDHSLLERVEYPDEPVGSDGVERVNEGVARREPTNSE